METPKTQKQARLLGVPKYNTGKPCKWGHISDRWALTGTCCECVLESGRRGREAFRLARESANG